METNYRYNTQLYSFCRNLLIENQKRLSFHIYVVPHIGFSPYRFLVHRSAIYCVTLRSSSRGNGKIMQLWYRCVVNHQVDDDHCSLFTATNWISLGNFVCFLLLYNNCWEMDSRVRAYPEQFLIHRRCTHSKFSTDSADISFALFLMITIVTQLRIFRIIYMIDWMLQRHDDNSFRTSGLMELQFAMRKMYSHFAENSTIKSLCI